MSVNDTGKPPLIGSRGFRHAVVTALLLATIYICFDGLLFAIVKNDGHEKLDGVEIGFEQDLRWEGALDGGRSKWFIGFVRPEGWAFARLQNNGSPIEQRCGYETFISIDVVALTIQPNKQIACRERRLPWL